MDLNLSPKRSPTGSLCSHADAVHLTLKDAAPVQRCTALSVVFGGARGGAQLRPIALHYLYRKTSLTLCDDSKSVAARGMSLFPALAS